MSTENALIKSFLEKFQEGYRERNISNIKTFVREMFSEKEGMVVVGTGLDEWATDYKGVERVIKKQWATEAEEFGRVDFKFDNAAIIEKDDAAFICSIAEVTRTICEESVCSKGLNNVEKILDEEIGEDLRIFKASREMAGVLRDIHMGDTYRNPLRFTAVLIKENNEYKCHQMMFSFDACFFWQHRYLTEKEVLPMFEMDKPFAEAAEIRNVLKKFQDGYAKKDISSINEFTGIFTMDDDMITIGTDADEFLRGPEELKQVLESDWKHWGDFKINLDGAIIVQNKDAAYFTTKAMIQKEITIDRIRSSAIQSLKFIINNKNIKDKKVKLLEGLYTMMVFMHEGEQGEKYYSPMRFSGFLINRNGKWLIQHIQYSDYITVAEKRI